MQGINQFANNDMPNMLDLLSKAKNGKKSYTATASVVTNILANKAAAVGDSVTLSPAYIAAKRAMANKSNPSAVGHVELVGGINGPMKRLPEYSVKTEVSGEPYLSKTKPEMTDEEYGEAIKKLAQNVVATCKNPYSDITDDFRKLKESYISVVSPDRAGIVATATAKGALIPAGTNNGHTAYAYAYDANGTQVAHYQENKGWVNDATKEELTRGGTFDGLYRAAIEEALKAKNSV